MRWKPIAWFCMAFLTCIVIGGPAFLATLQEKRQLAYQYNVQRNTIAQLRQQLEQADGRHQIELDREVQATQAKMQTRIDQLHQQLDGQKDALAQRDEQDAFERQMQQKLEEVESHIVELKKEALEARGDEEVELRTQLAALQTRHDQVEEKLAALNASDTQSWAERQQELRDAWDTLATTYASSQDQPPAKRVAAVTP